MDWQQLIIDVRARTSDPQRRTDYVSNRPVEVGPPASFEVIVETERALGFSLHALHSSLLTSIGNGGFGPGDGLVGVAGGVPDADGRNLLELRSQLWLDSETPMPDPVVPLCDWGDGIWSCLDSKTGDVLTMSELGLKDSGLQLEEWLAAWCHGEGLWEKLVELGERELTDPFSQLKRTVKVVVGTRGTPYKMKWFNELERIR